MNIIMTGKRVPIFSLVIIAAIVVLAAAFASSQPDGLEWIAEKLGFAPLAIGESHYTALTGLIGAAIVFFVVMIIGRFLRRK